MVAELIGALGSPATLLDCTLGGGGHAAAFLERGSTVVGIDRDADALRVATQRLMRFLASGQFQPHLGDFTRLERMPETADSRFDAVLADLGVSSWQLDSDERGFSFRPGVVLDMRMSGEDGETAADVLNGSAPERLTSIFRDYGDEPRARRLASEVTRRRRHRPFATSDDFVDAIRGALGASSGSQDFARLFQAIRIAVNDELTGLEQALPMLRDRLLRGGAIAIIAYHSGEDRIVKHAMREWSVACHCPPRQPVCTCGGIAAGSLITKKAVRATESEIAANPRARSARLRLWRKHE